MEFKAKLKNVYENVIDDCIEVVFELAENKWSLEALQQFTSKEQFCKVKVTNWSERRSLDANAFCWKMCTLLAEVLKTSKDEVYEHFIREYGYTDDEPIVLTVKSSVDMDKIDGHWKYLRESKDGRFKAYMRLRGTSEYNTKEMAHFLDMVVEECKENGVETMTPEELMKLKQAWGTQGGIINE